MKTIDDLTASVLSIHARYDAGRMERETVREWVLGLGFYPPPHDAALAAAQAWFRGKHDLPPDALKRADLDRLRAIAETGGVRQAAGSPIGRR